MRKTMAVLALAIFAACGGSDSTSPASASVGGTYSLKTINGSPLPFVFQSGTTSVTILADALVVGENGTWTESTSYKQTVNGQTSTGTGGDAGTWVRAGTAVTFTSTTQGGSGYRGTFTGSGLDMTDDNGFRSVFAK